MPVSELKQRMSAEEYVMWGAYDRVQQRLAENEERRQRPVAGKRQTKGD